MYDPDENKVTGVIDFGSAQLGDPAIDYAALSASYGEDFLRIAAELNPDIHVMMERVRFYKGRACTYGAFHQILIVILFICASRISYNANL